MHPRGQQAVRAQYLSRDKENIIQMKFRQQANQAVNKLELKYSKYTVQHVSPSLI